MRCTHWLLVIVLCGSWITGGLSGAAFKWHEFLGCTVLVLVSFRLLWGFFGTPHARYAIIELGAEIAVEWVTLAYDWEAAARAADANGRAEWARALRTGRM